MNRFGRLILGLAFCLLALPQEPDAARLFERALELRSAGDYAAAIPILQQAAEADPTQLRYWTALAETLGWNKRFSEAEAVYQRAAARLGSSRDLELGLARVDLWQGEYSRSIPRFEALLRANSSDAEALEGLAQASYWSGDFRRAERLFRRLLKLQPQNSDARRSLDEIASASRSVYRIALQGTDDDQPLDTLHSRAEFRVFTDPLTRFDIMVGNYQLEGEDLNRDASYVDLGGESYLPFLKLSLVAGARLVRFPDEDEELLGRAELSRRFGSNRVALSWRQTELLATATALEDHPWMSTASVGWEHSGSWLAAMAARWHDFYDENRGVSADGWVLFPLQRGGRWTILAGPSAAYKDVEENRFRFTTVDAIPSNGRFRYRYHGKYDPYWTPHDLSEIRLTVAAERTGWNDSRLRFQASGGYAQDRYLTFAPVSGTTPLPAFTHPFFFDRDYRPWEALAEFHVPLRQLEFSVTYRHTVTVFFRADALEASLVGRF